MKKISALLCVLGVFMVLAVRPALALSVKTSDDAVAVESSAYKAVISGKGGAMRSLILKSTGEDMVGSDGMGNDIETSLPSRNNLGTDYQLKVVKQQQDEVHVQATVEGSGSFQESGITYEKTYIFHENTPLITVGVRIINRGEPKRFAYRIFNAVTPGGRCAGNTYFVQKNTGLAAFELPASKDASNNFVKDISSGWSGSFNAAGRSALLCKVAPGATEKYLIFLSEKIATIEWYYNRIALDTGSVFSTEYFILPLSNVASAAASVETAEKLAGGKTPAAGVETPTVQAASNKGDAVLVAGAFDAYNLSSAYAYKVVQSLSKVPGLEVVLSQMSTDSVAFYMTHYLKGLPSSKAGLAKYGAVVMIDVPGWALDVKTQEALKAYVEDGGTLLMVGDHARGYKGSKLAEIFPLSFDYTTEIKGWAGPLMNDKSGCRKPSVADVASPVLNGIDCSDVPDAVVHKSVPAAGAGVIMKAGDSPLLAERTLGRGRIISFPISMTDKVDARAAYPDGLVDSSYWDDKITAWSFYDELLRNAVFCNKNKPSVSLSKVNVPGRDVISPAGVKIGADVVNGTNAGQSGTVNFILMKDGATFNQESAAYSLKPGARSSVVFKADLPQASAHYTYRTEVKDSDGKLLTWMDGNFIAHPSTCINLKLPYMKVFGSDGTVNLTATIVNPEGAGAYSIKTSLADPSGKVVRQLTPAPVDSTSLLLKQQMKLGNLRNGDYKIVSELLLGGRVIDTESEDIYIASRIDRENFYPNVAISSLIGNDREKAIADVQSMHGIGFNGLQIYNWGGYRRDRRDNYLVSNRFAAYEEAEKLGMVFIPASSYGQGSWNRWWRGNVLLNTDDFGKSDEEDAMDYHEAFGESPRHLSVYIADEPEIREFPWYKNEACKTAFKAKFGKELTNDKTSRDYYDSFKFAADSQAEVLKYGMGFFKKYNPGTDMGAALNLGGSMLGSNANMIASTLDYSAVDHYHYLTDAYALDVLWSASNFGDKAWLLPTTSIMYSGKYYPEYSGTQVYNALCHNAKGMVWFAWGGVYGIDDEIRQNSPKVQNMKRAFTELSTLGPLFKHLSKAPSGVAMLFPWATSIINSASSARAQDVAVWKGTHGLLSRAFGQVDFLQEEQIRRGEFLPERKMLVLAGARYLPEDVAQKIKDWTASGGLLVIIPGAPEFNQYQEKSNTLSGTFSASYGAEVTAQLEGGAMPVSGTALTPSGAQVILRYKDGSAAATSALYGKGRVVCFGFLPDDKSLVTNIVRGAAAGHAVSSSDKADVGYFPADGGFYVAAVNQIRKNVSTQITVQNVKSPRYAYDVLTGKEVPCTVNDGTAVVSVGLEPLWGRVIACLPARPSKLIVTAGRDKNLTFDIKLVDGIGNLVDAKLPVQITVKDGEGRNRPEYGGIRILSGGRFTVKSPLADNDPAGKWQVTVSEKISGASVTAVAGRTEK